MVESKGFCYGQRQKYSATITQHQHARNQPSPITTKQPPSGKRALLCCVSYKKKKFELKETIHDMRNMRDFLLHKFHFPRDSILILAERGIFGPDDEEHGRWFLVVDEGDSTRVLSAFYFSDHGLRQRGLHEDDVDGFDETIFPLNFETN